MTKQWELSGNAENVDWSDIAMAGRAYADNLIGEPGISAYMHIMADEIERLRGYRSQAESDASIASLLVDGSRLTEPEQSALQRAIDTLNSIQDLSPASTHDDAMAAARLMRLRDRLKPIGNVDSDRPQPIGWTGSTLTNVIE